MRGARSEDTGGFPSPADAAMTDTDPLALMGRVARGEHAAFAQLYDQLADRVFGLVRRVLRDPAQSEEVTQEVFIELWRTAPRFQPERGSVMAWTLTIAHRRAVDRVRATQAATERDARVAATRHDRPFDSVAAEVAGNFERQQVRRCLDALSELQRESIGLAYYQGYTYREVSRLLGTPLGTVKTRLRDGLIRLRDCLGVAR
jgi:RNA polymerase sigma-70 factor (ECF subfamily)